MEPIGDPQAKALLKQLAEMGVTPDQAAQELRRIRTTRQDRREARRGSLNERAQTEIGEIFGQLKINHKGKTLDRTRRANNYTWAVSELNRRVNERVGGKSADRQNFTLEQLDSAHDALPEIASAFKDEIKNAAS